MEHGTLQAIGHGSPEAVVTRSEAQASHPADHDLCRPGKKQQTNLNCCAYL